jgi:tetratricopeptide (TPR) repeat protein
VRKFRDLTTRTFCGHPKLLALILLAAMSVLAYANALNNSFHFDDIPGIVRNPTLRDWKNIPAYFTNPSTFGLGRTREWRPVLQITYALNYSIAGLNPSVFRIFNFLFHLGTAFLIFLIVKALGEQPQEPKSERRASANLPALFAAGLFAVHTANTEAVDYIWARSLVLATCFYVGAFYFLLRGPFSGRKETSLPWHLVGLASFALGMGTKATAVTLPGVLFFYEFLFLNPASKNPLTLFLEEPRRLKKYIPLSTLLAAYIAARFLLLPRLFTRVAAGGGNVSSLSYLLTQFRAWVYYLKLFLWPHPLVVDFAGFGWSHSLGDLRVLLSLGLVIMILFGAWFARKTQPLISFFAFWYFITLLPEASFIPLADAVVGYRAYLAYVGLAAIGALLIFNAPTWIQRILRKPAETGDSRRAVWLAAVVLIALTAATIARNRDWRDETTLWSDVVKKDPANHRAYMMLGAQFLYQENYETARQMFDKAIQLDRRSSHGYVLRGYLNSHLNRNEEALSDFETAMKLDPRDPYGRFYRGELHRKLGEGDKALDDYKTALKFQPFYTDAYLEMAMAYLDKEEIVKATDACAKLVEIDPTDRRGYDCLGTLLIEQNRIAEALKLYEIGVKRIPHDGDLWYSLGVAYEKSGMYAQAGKAFERATQAMSRPDRRTPESGPVVE